MKRFGLILFMVLWALPAWAAPLIKGVWVRPYAKDASEYRVSEVFDNLKLVGATEIYLETFWGGKLTYPSTLFPEKYPGTNILSTYLKEAKKRKIKVYAWLHTTDFGKDYAAAHPDHLVLDGYGQTSQATEAHSWMVSPAVPEVQERLSMLAKELTQQGVHGIILDYLRYPIRIKNGDVDETADPRNFWGYNPTQIAQFYADNPEHNREDYRRFLETGEVDAALREGYLNVWKDWNAAQYEKLVQRLRATLAGKAALSMAFFPNYYFHPHDSRLQESKRWFKHFDRLFPMCYSYYLDDNPGPYGTYNINRELGIIEDGLKGMKKKPSVVAALTEDPPGTPKSASFHHRIFREQVAYLLGRQLANAYPNLKGFAYFSYGWMFPDSEKARKE